MQFVYGLSKSGISVTKYFVKKNIKFSCWDDDKIQRIKFKNKNNNIKLENPKKINLNKFDKIYVSPGISVRNRQFKNIKNFESKIFRDLNLYAENISNQNIIAITGTNGKSTTTKLIGDIFKKSKFNTFIGGNLGIPLLNAYLNKNNYSHHVIELSSFQLELINDFKPSVSILLNLSKDHLDRYDNFRDYIKQKKKIFSNDKRSFNVFSIDDKNSKEFIKDKKIFNKITFSIFNSKANIYYKEKFIYDNYFHKNKRIKIDPISIDLKEKYNLQNILAAYIVSKIYNISSKIFKEIIKKYKGLPYRSKVLKNNKKFLVINNSKATNLESTINSIDNYNNIILIIGGRAKENNFKKINKLSKNIMKIYLYGESAKLIQSQINLNIEKKIFHKLDDVVKDIFNKKKYESKTTILFAPGCSSFDQYKNFEERGNHFTKLIKDYSKRDQK